MQSMIQIPVRWPVSLLAGLAAVAHLLTQDADIAGLVQGSLAGALRVRAGVTDTVNVVASQLMVHIAFDTIIISYYTATSCCAV